MQIERMRPASSAKPKTNRIGSLRLNLLCRWCCPLLRSTVRFVVPGKDGFSRLACGGTYHNGGGTRNEITSRGRDIRSVVKSMGR